MERTKLPENGLAAFADAMDRCWLEQRFDDLACYIADDVVMVAPGGIHRAEGLAEAISSYREFMSRSTVDKFATAERVVTERGDTAVIEYSWEMSWRTGVAEYEESGREVLVLARRNSVWRVVWRTQIPAAA